MKIEVLKRTMNSFVGINVNKASYFTWYEFKKDLQKEAKYSILDREWLQIKPHEPLPWDIIHPIISDLALKNLFG